jgi:DNA-binding PadR family transcriptional regulator
MTAPQLEILISLYAKTRDFIYSEGYGEDFFSELKDNGYLESRGGGRVFLITDKGKSLVKRIVDIASVQGWLWSKEQLEKITEKSSNRIATEMGASAKACGEGTDLTILTQAKKLEEINKLKPKYILKKDLPFAKAGTKVYTNRAGDFFVKNGNRERCIAAGKEERQNVISEGWIEKVKPREFFLKVSGTLMTIISEKGDSLPLADGIIKVREVID